MKIVWYGSLIYHVFFVKTLDNLQTNFTTYNLHTSYSDLQCFLHKTLDNLHNFSYYGEITVFSVMNMYMYFEKTK